MKRPEEEKADTALPESREYIIPGREDIFKSGEKYYLYMGKHAGWMKADRIHITKEGNVVGVRGEVDREAAREAAERILASVKGLCKA